VNTPKEAMVHFEKAVPYLLHVKNKVVSALFIMHC
jgi:hypothetical protein